jgi:hypothetical protein
VTNDMSLGEPSGIEQGDDVSRCGSGSIVASPAGSSGSSVATLSRSKRSQPLSVQPTRNGFEAGRLLRKSMQQYHRWSLSKTGVDNTEAQARA